MAGHAQQVSFQGAGSCQVSCSSREQCASVRPQRDCKNFPVAASGEEEVPEANLPEGHAADPEPEDQDQDQRRPHAMRCPREPTAAEKAAHEFTH